MIHTIPVYDGFTLAHAMQRQNIAGRALSHWIAELLTEVGVELMTVSDLQLAKDIKENVCRVRRHALNVVWRECGCRCLWTLTERS